ncbi:MAG: anthranilate synthase component I family protein [Flavobacteriaceae bacterium]|nr:anthranilate synthase component I family protein [Flavobacteriaceae bacterium]
MIKFRFDTKSIRITADLLTPVEVYLKLRDHFPNSLLLESSDYGGQNKSYSYICCNPIASITIKDSTAKYQYPNGRTYSKKISSKDHVAEVMHNFSRHFTFEKQNKEFITQGMFGFISHEAVGYFEDIKLNQSKPGFDIPDIYYAVYQNIIAISLFSHEAHIYSHVTEELKHNIKKISDFITESRVLEYPFKALDEPHANMGDDEYMSLVKKAKWHCKRGDVFQLVLSRRYTRFFKGDEFNVYRALRSINPSPYQYFFDYGNFKIFGSSPEAHLVVKNGKAEIHPIAGTSKRTGNHKEDLKAAKDLIENSKENSEHVMLVDLARNDLSRNGTHVKVIKNREVQFFSHVIHLVSKVTAELDPDVSIFQLVADTFPAGTLSGAPKHRALELIDRYERSRRNIYGGAIGYFDFHGKFDHAIIIRSFLSMSQKLIYQGGAGLVVDSNPKSELNEVENKLKALEKAISEAEKI